MKLRDEHIKSHIDDIRMVGLLNLLTWKGNDVAFAWIGPHEPATRSDDRDLNALAHGNRVHYLYYRALVEKYLEEGSSVLDVGCGSGQRTAMLARYAKSVVGIDSDVSKISMAPLLNHAPNIGWAMADFLKWDYGGTFDAVFAVEVIEHVELNEQDSFIDMLLKKVSPGGSLLITTPRDVPVHRAPPHIGLWDGSIARKFSDALGCEIEYFSRDILTDGRTSPWCGLEESTHYVLRAEGKK